VACLVRLRSLTIEAVQHSLSPCDFAFSPLRISPLIALEHDTSELVFGEARLRGPVKHCGVKHHALCRGRHWITKQYSRTAQAEYYSLSSLHIITSKHQSPGPCPFRHHIPQPSCSAQRRHCQTPCPAVCHSPPEPHFQSLLS
jgi:hypothetical protein